jgi:ferric-dicitrate binding protein FerR (iron transport regulator)
VAPASNTPDEKLIERALMLIVQCEAAPHESATAAYAALDEWRGKSAAHEAAAQEAHRRWDALGGIAANLRARRE